MRIDAKLWPAKVKTPEVTSLENQVRNLENKLKIQRAENFRLRREADNPTLLMELRDGERSLKIYKHSFSRQAQIRAAIVEFMQRGLIL